MSFTVYRLLYSIVTLSYVVIVRVDECGQVDVDDIPNLTRD